MYQVMSIINWRSKEVGDKAHRTIIPHILDRWEEGAPLGSQAFVARCSDTQTTFSALFPLSEEIANDPKRKKMRLLINAVMKESIADERLVILEGEIVENRTRE